MNRATWLQDRRMEKFGMLLNRWERRGVVGAGGGRVFGHVGAAVPPLPAALRGGRAGRAARPAAGQGRRRGGSRSTRSMRMLEHYRERYAGLEREAFPRAAGARAQLRPGATPGSRRSCMRPGWCERAQAARRAPAQARAQAVRGHDAAPGRLAPRPGLPGSRRSTWSSRWTMPPADLFGLPGRGGRHRLELSRAARGVRRPRACRSASIPIAAATTSYTPKAGEAVDKERLTQVGRALDGSASSTSPAYSPEARGRSERMFGTLQDRLPRS